MAGALFPLALALCVAGPVALRLGWQRRRALVALGWGALALAAFVLMREGGAWGLAAGSTVAMVSALALLTHATLATAPPRRVPAERVTAPLPREAIDWPDVSRRVGVFLVVVVLDLCASLLLAWSVQRALFRAGSSAADVTALALFLLPLLWLALASWQMTQDRLWAMLPAPAALIILGGLIWLAT